MGGGLAYCIVCSAVEEDDESSSMPGYAYYETLVFFSISTIRDYRL